jgi:hypothetical protein
MTAQENPTINQPNRRVERGVTCPLGPQTQLCSLELWRGFQENILGASSIPHHEVGVLTARHLMIEDARIRGPNIGLEASVK